MKYDANDFIHWTDGSGAVVFTTSIGTAAKGTGFKTVKPSSGIFVTFWDGSDMDAFKVAVIERKIIYFNILQISWKLRRKFNFYLKLK